MRSFGFAQDDKLFHMLSRQTFLYVALASILICHPAKPFKMSSWQAFKMSSRPQWRDLLHLALGTWHWAFPDWVVILTQLPKRGYPSAQASIIGWLAHDDSSGYLAANPALGTPRS